MENQKNLILAVVFSIIVLLGFDLFFPKQKIDPSTQTNKVIEKQSINQEDLEPSIESRIQTKKKNVTKNKEDRITFDMERKETRLGIYL